MKSLWIGLALLTLAAPLPPAFAQGKAAARQPLRPVSACLRIDRINEWHVIDARTLTARTGPDRYLIKLGTDCPRFSYGPRTLRFHPNPSERATAPFSICGEAGETVSSPTQPPCGIQSVRKIDKAQFDQLSAKAKRGGTAAELPTRP